MPNHITNRLELVGDQSKINEFLEAVRYDSEPIVALDFNKVIPMPESLDVTSGSIEKDSIMAYLKAACPITVEKQVFISLIGTKTRR